MSFKQVLFVSLLVVAAAEIYQSQGRKLKNFSFNRETSSESSTDADGNSESSESTSTQAEFDFEKAFEAAKEAAKEAIEKAKEDAKEVIEACTDAFCTIIDKIRESPTPSPNPPSTPPAPQAPIYTGGVDFQDLMSQGQFPDNFQELTDIFGGFGSSGADLGDGTQVGGAIANFQADFGSIDFQNSGNPVAAEFSSLFDNLGGSGNLPGNKKGSFETAPTNNLMALILSD